MTQSSTLPAGARQVTAKVLADGLAFPEGPMWMKDGSIVLVEIRGEVLTRVWPDGRKTTVAKLGGGPNGAAMGPDGYCYVCNNGGFKWKFHDGRYVTAGQPENYKGGRIERVNLDTGAFELVYDRVDGHAMSSPNDIVFDRQGGFYVTDTGKMRERDADRGAVYYGRADGSGIREVIFPISMPNGVGLSPDGGKLYVTETETARLWSWDVTGPGELQHAPWPASPHGGTLLYNAAAYTRFDSLAVEQNGNVCLATLDIGAITVCAPGGERVELLKIPGDTHVTNICFGGDDMQRAFITLSHKGLLVEVAWPRPGLRLNG